MTQRQSTGGADRLLLSFVLPYVPPTLVIVSLYAGALYHDCRLRISYGIDRLTTIYHGHR